MGTGLTICLLRAVLMEQKCVEIIGLGERGRAAGEAQPLTWWKPNGNNCRCFDRAYMIAHNKHPVFFRSNLHQIAALCWNRLFRCPLFGCWHLALWFTQSKLSFFIPDKQSRAAALEGLTGVKKGVVKQDILPPLSLLFSLFITLLFLFVFVFASEKASKFCFSRNGSLAH